MIVTFMGILAIICGSVVTGYGITTNDVIITTLGLLPLALGLLMLINEYWKWRARKRFNPSKR